VLAGDEGRSAVDADAISLLLDEGDDSVHDRGRPDAKDGADGD
jgi:hypothetical protein